MVFSSFKIRKSAIHGKGEDTVGKFEIFGNIDENNEAHFIKQYIGQHQVEYHGTYKNKKSISGNWSMPAHGMSDAFTISVII